MAREAKRYVISSQTILGTEVRGRKGARLGSIAEIMVDCSHDRVAYCVLSAEGESEGRKLFAIPWSELVYQDDGPHYSLDLAREDLRRAKGFDEDHWPDTDDPFWADGLERFQREWQSDDG